MSEPAGHYTEPLEEALSQGAQRVAQIASLLGAVAEVTMRRKVLKDAREAAGTTGQARQIIGEQERDAYQQARLRWAPAHDPVWLAQANLLQTARAWSAAACYADTDPMAASAMRKCEERLRTLHPHAMARYDRLRAEAASALDAMREAAPLFGQAPHARTGDAATARPALEPASGQSASPPAGETVGAPDEPDPDAELAERAEQRGRRIAAQLRARTRAAKRGELGPDDLAIVLETVTNLPGDVIARIVRPTGGDAEHARAGDLDQAAGLTAAPAAGEPARDRATASRETGTADAARARGTAGRTAAQMAAESFPHSAADVVSAAGAGAGRGTRSPGRTAAPRQARQPGRTV